MVISNDMNMEVSDACIVNADVPSESTNEVRSVDAVPGGNGVNNVGVPSAVVSPANTNVEVNNVSSTDSPPQPNNLDAGACSNAVDGDTYASRAARTAGPGDNAPQAWRRFLPNDMPKRPRSALFTPSRSTSARSVFDAFKTANIDAAEIQCLQRKMNGEVVVTFNSSAAKEKFVGLNSIWINNDNYAIQDIDRPLTFLTVYDAPFELSDWAIIKRLAPYCEVVHYRRGRFDYAPAIYNGLRHYRVRITRPIPNFLRFGRYQVFLKYAGQPLTCRKCNQPGHFSNACEHKVCFNCENIGHEANSCPAPPLCHFCKGDGHVSSRCRYSWVSPVVFGEPTDECAPVNVEDSDNDDDASDVTDASFKTHSDDSFAWADESDLSDAYVDVVEELPLAAALPSNAQQPSPADTAGSSPVTATPSASTSSSVPPSAAETPVLFTPSESPPNAQPVNASSVVNPPPADSQSQHVLDSQGLLKPDVIVLDAPSEPSPANPPPANPPPANPPSVNPSTSSARPRISRRTPAPVPEALAAAARRKPTSPSLVSGKPRSASPSSPMETVSVSDLKRKAHTQTDAVPKEKRRQKKGRKHKD